MTETADAVDSESSQHRDLEREAAEEPDTERQNPSASDAVEAALADLEASPSRVRRRVS